MKNMGDEFLVHHGIKGQRWGIRRFQNADGSLTKAGEKRYRQRQQDTKKYESENISYKQDLAKRKNELEDLNKNGAKSKIWYDGYDNPDFDLGKDTYDAWGFSSEKEGINYLKKVLKEDIDFYQDSIETNNDRINNIKNVPIHEKSYSEKMRDGERAAKAVFAAGAISSVAASALAGTVLNDGKLAAKAALIGIGASAFASVDAKLKGIDKANNYLDRYTETSMNNERRSSK